MIRTVIACIISALIFSSAIYAQSPNGDLSRVTHSGTLRFMTRDHNCIAAHIIRTDAISITIHPYVSKLTADQTLAKKDLLFAGESVGNSDAVFSGRSSWADVTAVKLSGREYLRIIMKSGEGISVRKVNVTPVSIIIGSGKQARTVAKDDIRAIEYVRYLPTTDDRRYFEQEASVLAIFTPTFIGRVTGLSPMMAVRLYDVALPEDNSQLSCNRDSSH